MNFQKLAEQIKAELDKVTNQTQIAKINKTYDEKIEKLEIERRKKLAELFVDEEAKKKLEKALAALNIDVSMMASTEKTKKAPKNSNENNEAA
jgi:hypothetical protein